MFAKRSIVILFLICGLAFPVQVVASPATPLLKALAKYFSKEGAEKLTKEVSEDMAERVANNLAREGGEKMFEHVAELAAKHGPDIIRALDNSPEIKSVLKAIDELPADDVAKAAQRLAAGGTGRELASMTQEYGAKVLLAEVKQPGVGSRLVRVWGDDGASLCGRLTKDEAISLGKYADDLAMVPSAQRNQLLEVIEGDKDRFFRWLGDFIQKNPGKTIGSATFLAVFLPNSERILGGNEIVFDASGNPVVLRKPGLLEAPTEAFSQGLSWLTKGIAIVVVSSLALFAAIKLWNVWHRARSPHSVRFAGRGSGKD